MAEHNTYQTSGEKFFKPLILFGLLLLFACQSAFSQDVKEFDDETYKSLQESVNYSETPKIDRSRGLDLDLDLNIPPLLAKLFMYMLIPILLIALFVIIRNQSKNLSKQKTKPVDIRNIPENAEDPDKLDLEQMLTDAMNANDHRSALRILYLQVIKLLMQNKMIEWRIDKTNRQYINELRSFPNEKAEFAALTKIYERYWYGEQGLEATLFSEIKLQFTSFKSQMFNQTT